MKNKLIIILSIVVVLLIVGFGIFFYLKLSPAARLEQEKIFVEVTEQTGISALVGGLKTKGAVRSRAATKIYIIFRYAGRRPPEGVYVVDPAKTAPQILRQIYKEEPNAFSVTVPEGFTVAQIAIRLQNHGSIPAQDFYMLARDKEGYLFPDTYFFEIGAESAEILKKMQDNFSEKTKDLKLKNDDVVLASIVERETNKAEERPQIAALYLSRLRQGMKLEADPTIRYGMDKDAVEKNRLSPNYEFWQPISAADYKYQTIYNAYLHDGLPPTSICNPGLESLRAALSPTPNFEYLYFFHKDGEIYFSKTLEEHQQKVKEMYSE